MNSEKKIGVLFVCLGNICRSPAAEGAFTHIVKERNLQDKFIIDSCGTGGWHCGELPHETTRKVAKSRGIELTHKARQFRKEDLKNFDFILAMDSSNYQDILLLTSNDSLKKKVFKFRKFDPEANGEPDVPDPFYSGRADFENVQEIVSRTSLGFLDFLITENFVEI
jgi:protein-tyrosine phosphatase